MNELYALFRWFKYKRMVVPGLATESPLGCQRVLMECHNREDERQREREGKRQANILLGFKRKVLSDTLY